MVLLFVLVESLRLLQQHVFDGIVKQELSTEVAELLAQELIKLLHHWVQDSNTMCSDRVEHLIDANSSDLLGLLGLLYEDLLVEIVSILLHKDLSLLQQEHDIDALIELLGGQV